MAFSFPKVNLAGNRVEQRKAADRKKTSVTRGSVIALVVFLAIFVPVLIIRFSFNIRKNNIEDDIAQLTNDIKSLEAAETKYLLLTTKSTAILSLESDRVIVQPKILEVYEIMPQGTTIDDVSFGEGGDFLDVSLVAVDVFALGDLLKNVTDSVGTRFTMVRIDSTRRSDDGTYQVAMEIHFAGQEKS